MTFLEATQYWNALSPQEKQPFYSIASKSDGNHTAFEWFNHLVPDELKDDPEQIELFMDGGVVTVDNTDTILPDRDVSRIESGANGGEYTVDNTIMEESSVNRARGAADMTTEEFQSAVESNSEAVDLIEAADGGAEALTQVTATEVLGTVADAALAGVAAYKVGSYVYDNVPKDWDEEDKVAATGGAALGTALLAFTPPGQFVIGCYVAFKLVNVGRKLINKFA